MSNPYGNNPGGQEPQNPYGAPSYSAYGGGGGGFQDQTKTDGVSIAALVTGLICCAPVSVILGFVGIKRTKGGQRKGRGMAITGLVLGLLGVLAWVGIGIAAIAGVAWFNSIVTPEDAEVGQCIDVSEDNNEVILYEKECAEDHDGEIVAVVDVTDENVDVVGDGMVNHCLDEISEDDRSKLVEHFGSEQAMVEALQGVAEDPNNIDVGDSLVCYVEFDDPIDESVL